MSTSSDSQSDQPGGELVPVDGEQVAWARPLPAEGASSAVPVVAPRRASLPATVAAAGGGFALGVAAFLILKVLRRPTAASSLSRRRGRLLARRRGVEVAGSRSFLVDVHLLKR